jgi:Zn-dependent protease
MKQSFKLFNFRGTPVYLSLWFFLLFLLTSVNVVISIFISVLIHELAHALVANLKGYKVHSVNIDMFSGSASIDTNMHDRDSIPIVAAGPISNILLAILGLSSIYILPVDILILSKDFISSFITINIILAVFNILPIYPMDGGQIVRSLANLSKNRSKARRIASLISVVFSVSLFIYALVSLSILTAILALYFTYLSLKELNIIK